MESFIGQIILVPYNFAPRGWAFCNGQLMSISQNAALFSLLGTTYGGDGERTFALPNLQGNVALGASGSYILGEAGGSAYVTLTADELPVHTHSFPASDQTATSTSLANHSFAVPDVNPRMQDLYSKTGSTLGGAIIQAQGGSQPHLNLQPFLVMNYIIALEGIFPPRN